MINTITNFEDLNSYLHEYVCNLSTGDFGFENKRIKSLPKIYEDMIKWECANLEFLQPKEKEIYFRFKQHVENFTEYFKKMGLLKIN